MNSSTSRRASRWCRRRRSRNAARCDLVRIFAQTSERALDCFGQKLARAVDTLPESRDLGASTTGTNFPLAELGDEKQNGVGADIDRGDALVHAGQILVPAANYWRGSSGRAFPRRSEDHQLDAPVFLHSFGVFVARHRIGVAVTRGTPVIGGQPAAASFFADRRYQEGQNLT